MAGPEDSAPGGRTALDRHPSLWIHGAGLSGSTWREVTSGLPQARTPDLPGHGSAPIVTPARVERFAEALQPSVPAGCILIGHSLGGMVALELAARLTNEVAALIVVETVPTVRDRRVQHALSWVAARVFSALPPKALAWLSGLGEQPVVQKEVRAQIARNSRASLSAALEAALAYDGRDRLARIAVPTLVITGRDNRATHRGAALIAETIRGAEEVTLPGGHMLHWDNPTGLRGAIDSFLARRLGR